MKKISLYASALLVSGLGFTACDVDHNDLRLEPPTTYTLEAPEGADQLMIFGIMGSNVDNQLAVKTMNPYNINTTVDFQVQVAKSEADFLLWDDMVANEINGGESDGNFDFTDANGLPYVVTISNLFTSPVFNLPGADFCGGINSLYGFEEDEAEGQVVSVAYRVHAWVPNVGYSSIFSNIVTLDKVQTYNPLKEPKRIYLIGQPQGWNIDNGDMYAEETTIGSNIYYGKFTINAGQFQFRFYSELGNWDENSIGSQDEDTPIDIEFTDDTYEGDVVVYNAAQDVLGKGSWQYNAWTGGTVEVTVNLNDYTISMVAHEGEVGPVNPAGNVLYLIGKPQGWDINNGDLYMTETNTGSNVYRGVFDVKEGDFQFRFYSALGDWETNSIGAQVEDQAVAITFTDGGYEGDCVLGKGAWQYDDWAGGFVEVIIDLNEMKISMAEYNEVRNIYLIGQPQGWDINSDAMPLKETGVYTNVFTGTYNIGPGEFQLRFYSALGDWEHNSIGSQDADSPTMIDMSAGYSGPCFYDPAVSGAGKGAWEDSSWGGGDVTFTVDLNKLEVEFKR